MASSSQSRKLCFNSTCKEVLEVSRKGWLCRTGEFADLCDRCSTVFKDGKFCDTYHLNASGWRCCESCGKQIHCGCIVSFHMFILLDAGGIECLNCAKTEFILTPNPTWPSASNFQPGPSERIRDISSRNWRSIAGSGPIPWRQAPSLFNTSKLQHGFHSRTPFEVDILNTVHKPLAKEQLSSCSLGKITPAYPSEKLVNGNWLVGPSEIAGSRANPTGVQYDGQHNLFGDISHRPFVYTNELATPISSFPATLVSQDKKSEKGKEYGTHAQLCPPPLVGKQPSNNNNRSFEAQSYNAKARGETRGKNQPLPRYWPRITDQELQQISGGSNGTITPLFEKVLSASDAGRIGRLVLPKKCAEAYLPPISHPEGYPLVVQDLKGKDWVLQFRFWPNNNSRMYVLEGVTPCIQSMQLQAGDTVTFSRLEPEGKLVMGFRKALPASLFDQGKETKNSNCEESSKGSVKNPDGSKRKKGANMGSNSKQLKLNDEEIVELNVTLEQVQGLLQPPLANTPTIVLVEGVQFENYQEAPIIGSPTLFSTNHVGSVCSTEVKPTPERLEHTIDHENEESLETMEGLDALADLAIQDRDHVPGCTIQPPKHKSSCTCNVCLAIPTPNLDAEKEVGNSIQNLYSQRGNSSQEQITMAGGSVEKETNLDKTSTPFKSQNIDLNIQPEREEECSPVLDSFGVMRYIRHQKL